MNGLFEIIKQSIVYRITSHIRQGVAFIIPGILLSCNANSGNAQKEHIDNVTAEQPVVVAQIDTALVSRAYRITDVSAGPFSIGAVIQDTIDGFEVEKSTEIKTVSDEMTIEIPIYTYYIGNEGWVKITPQYDPTTGKMTDKVGEIFVYSDLFLTDKGIGAVSSLEDFDNTYPDINIRYIGEDDMFALQTSQMPNVQFLLRGEYYVGTEQDSMSSSHAKLNVSDFEENSYFAAIRIIKEDRYGI